MDNTIRAERKKNAEENRIHVAAVRVKYPGFDKTSYSKVKKEEYYGIRLAVGAKKIIDDMSDSAPRRADNRKYPNRVQCRLPDGLHSELQQYLNESGMTTQDYLFKLIKRDLQARKNRQIAKEQRMNKRIRQLMGIR